MKIHKIFLIIMILLVICVGWTQAAGTWLLEGGQYHAEGTWYVPPYLGTENIDIYASPIEIYKGSPATVGYPTELDVDISYKLNWLPAGLLARNRPVKKIWIKEYGFTRSAFTSYSGLLTRDCFVTSDVQGLETQGQTTPSIPNGSVWTQKETQLLPDSPWLEVNGESGIIERSVNMTASTSPDPQDAGPAYATALFRIEQLSSTKQDYMNPYAGSSGTTTSPITFDPIHGIGGGDPIDYVTGQHLYLPAPDIVVYNPYGPPAVFHRNYYSTVARDVGYSPGLTSGWVHNYDVMIYKKDSGLLLRYPNGYEESINPSNGSKPSGSPYTVSGVASGSGWASITITFKDQTKWEFTPSSGNTDLYLLTRLINRMGRYISLSYEHVLIQSIDDYRLTKVDADQVIKNGSTTLLKINYSGLFISSIVDIYGRSVGYQVSSPQILTKVTTLNNTLGSRWEYEYRITVSISSEPTPFIEPHMTKIKFLSPSGGYTTQTLDWDGPIKISYISSPGTLPVKQQEPRVYSFTDGNGNKTEFTYQPDDTNTTVVNISNPNSVVEKSYTVSYETAPDGGYRITGKKDANNNSITMMYGSTCPYKPTKITDKNGKITEFTYDQHGNILTIKRPRGTVTTFTYDYTVFPLGRLTSVQESGKPAATITYFEPSGLVNTITSPSPTGTGTVQASYTYDALGNRLTATVPDSSGNNVTITYNYTTDGMYTQDAKLGQPLLITDSLGRKTHYRYDERGNVTSAVDDAGNETNITYNIADQPLRVTLPPDK